ncbi:MAG: hypothetical protein ACD_39C00444G0004, partial [uncultured bacterium]
MFYLIVLLFALSWRLVNAGSESNGIADLRIEEHAADTEIIISLNAAERPAASFSGDNWCLVLDFRNAQVNANHVEKAYASRDLRLGYITVLKQKPGDARVRLYIRPGCLASLRYRDRDVIVRIAEKTALSVQTSIEPGFLLSPAEEKYAPAVISLHEAPLWPVINELATLAGVEVERSGSLPEKFSAELQAASPLEALKELAAKCDLELLRRGQIWHIGPP